MTTSPRVSGPAASARPGWLLGGLLCGLRASSCRLPPLAALLLTASPPVCVPACSDAGALREAFNDALYFKDEAVRAFKLGVLSLEERAQVGWGLQRRRGRPSGSSYTKSIPSVVSKIGIPRAWLLHLVDLLQQARPPASLDFSTTVPQPTRLHRWT